jgi:hypothetical protein
MGIFRRNDKMSKKKGKKKGKETVDAGTERVALGQPPMPPPQYAQPQQPQRQGYPYPPQYAPQPQTPPPQPQPPQQGVMVSEEVKDVLDEVFPLGEALGGFEAAALVHVIIELRKLREVIEEG